MPSTFTWLDYSETDRRRMLDVIDLFRQKETRDELGLAVVRDAFADLFFPGTSVVQTRARYFLFIPWMYRELERRNVSARDVARVGRDYELRLIEILLRGREPDGVIGRVSRRRLQRLPSGIYWQGLGAWGIRRFDGAQTDYHRLFDRFVRRTRTGARADDGENYETVGDAWHENLPSPPAGFPENASLDLTLDEAEYLAERITTSFPRSLLALMVQRNDPFDAEQRTAWDSLIDADGEQRMWLDHAQNFSGMMHGAALLYNLMLAEKRVEDTGEGDAVVMYNGWVADYRDALRRWNLSMQQERARFLAWDRAAFWRLLDGLGARVTFATRTFVEAWSRHVLLHIADLPVLMTQGSLIVAERELQLKGGKSRLQVRRARELWLGASGALPLLYRWPSAVRIANDIITALNGGAA